MEENLTVRYPIGRAYCIFIQGGIVHTVAKFYIDDYSANNSLPAINGEKQPITVLNLSAGISLKL